MKLLTVTVLFGMGIALAQLQPPPSPRTSKREGHQPQEHSQSTQKMSTTDQRGTENSPIVVKVVPTTKTDEEAAKEKQFQEDISAANWWMVRLTAIIGVIGLFQLMAFAWQARRLRQTIEKMDEIARGQTDDMRASIAEATRAATAMEGIASFIAANVISVQESVTISREISERQKIVTELGNRAYLSVSFGDAIYQDAHHHFEAKADVVNRGSTPAYDVTFKADVGILPVPIPSEFEFPLPSNTAGTSVSFIAPGLPKIITRTLPHRVADGDVAAIKHGGPPQCFAMWGIVNYRDAFHEPRFVKFAFVVSWIDWVEGMGRDKDGNPLPPKIMSYDTARHNEAN